MIRKQNELLASIMQQSREREEALRAVEQEKDRQIQELKQQMLAFQRQFTDPRPPPPETIKVSSDISLMQREVEAIKSAAPTEVEQMKKKPQDVAPLTSVPYVKPARPPSIPFTSGKKHRQKGHSQTLRAICIRNDTKSDGRLFYIPSSAQVISSADYVLDQMPPSGPLFKLEYDGCIDFNLYEDSERLLRPPIYTPNEEVLIKRDNTSPVLATIVNIPFTPKETYTIQYTSTGNVAEVSEDDIIPYQPPNNATETPTVISGVLWAKHLQKVTLWLPSMSRPHQGTLIHDKENSQWLFIPGRDHTKKSKAISIPNLDQIVPSLIRQKRITPGWISIQKMQTGLALAHAQNITVRRMQLLQTSNPLHLNRDITISRIAQQKIIRYHGRQQQSDLTENALPPPLKTTRILHHTTNFSGMRRIIRNILGYMTQHRHGNT